MRILVAVLTLFISQAFATSIVYKAQTADGVIVLSDRPIKEVDHQEIIHLDNSQPMLSHNSIQNQITPGKSDPQQKHALENKINLARLEIEKARSELTHAKIGQLKAERECATHQYRNSQKESPCHTPSITTEELQLAKARANLMQLQEQVGLVG